MWVSKSFEHCVKTSQFKQIKIVDGRRMMAQRLFQELHNAVNKLKIYQ